MSHTTNGCHSAFVMLSQMFQNQLLLETSQTQTVTHRLVVIQAMPLLISLLEA